MQFVKALSRQLLWVSMTMVKMWKHRVGVSNKINVFHPHEKMREDQMLKMYVTPWVRDV